MTKSAEHPPVVQQFLSKDGGSLHSLRAHRVGHFGDYFIYWDEIQETFNNNVSYLLDNRGERVLFEVALNADDSAHDMHPQHIHISDHPGYELDRHLEFFQQFGHFALIILEAI
ncbi:hypothetical protein BGZ81_002465 [Podila clonocystis]|nr:hypothetical protein BGZ81_002465 [Podila clonocystis]